MLIIGYASSIDVVVYTEEQLPLLATFACHVKAGPHVFSDTENLAELTSVAVVETAANTNPDVDAAFVATVQISFSAADTADITDRELILDVARTDLVEPEHLGWKLRVWPTFPVTKVP